MKRLLVLALLALGLTIVVVPTATPAAPSDAKGPPCSNIIDRDIGYGPNLVLPDGVIDFTLFLQAPACSFVTYSFIVTNTDGTAITPISTTQNAACEPATPDGGCVHFVYDLGTDSPQTVCYSATTEIKGHHFADLAPNFSDSSCPPTSPSFSVSKGDSGASGSFG
jgi:hypothetical protein